MKSLSNSYTALATKDLRDLRGHGSVAMWHEPSWAGAAVTS